MYDGRKRLFHIEPNLKMAVFGDTAFTRRAPGIMNLKSGAA